MLTDAEESGSGAEGPIRESQDGNVFGVLAGLVPSTLAASFTPGWRQSWIHGYPEGGPWSRGEEPLSRALQGDVCGLIQALQHGRPELSRGGEGALIGLRHLEANEEHPYIYELWKVRAAEVQSLC